MSTPSSLPSLDDLRCFVAGARHLSFRRAAREVHLTPAAFGQRIRHLEETLGCALFERTTRRVALTAAGQRLLPSAEGTLQQAARCRDAVAPEATVPARLRLGTRFELGVSWLVPAVRDLATTLPHLTLDLYFGSGPDILARLADGLLDAVVTSAAVARHEWASEFLHREDYLFVGSPGRLAEAPFGSAADAPRHVLLDVDETLPLSRYLTSALPAPLDFADIRLCGAGEAIRQLAVAGHGLAVLPAYLARPNLVSGHLLQLLPDLPLLADSFRLLFHRRSAHEPTLRQLAALLRDRPLT